VCAFACVCPDLQYWVVPQHGVCVFVCASEVVSPSAQSHLISPCDNDNGLSLKEWGVYVYMLVYLSL